MCDTSYRSIENKSNRFCNSLHCFQLIFFLFFNKTLWPVLKMIAVENCKTSLFHLCFFLSSLRYFISHSIWLSTSCTKLRCSQNEQTAQSTFTKRVKQLYFSFAIHVCLFLSHSLFYLVLALNRLISIQIRNNERTDGRTNERTNKKEHTHSHSKCECNLRLESIAIKVNDKERERKSTQAASVYTYISHIMYRDWYLSSLFTNSKWFGIRSLLVRLFLKHSFGHLWFGNFCLFFAFCVRARLFVMVSVSSLFSFISVSL